MIVRDAATGDIPAIAAILAASDEDDSWPDVPGHPYIEHLLARGRIPLAETKGEAIGMAGVIEVGTTGARFLSDLFVHPERQDRGAGRALLAAAFDGAVGRLTFSSADARALGLYLRTGLRPWWPQLYMDVPRSALGAADPGLVAEPADPVVTAHWSEAWTGMDRSPDFAHYAGLPGGAGHVIVADGSPAAVVWANRRRVRPGRALAHVSIAPDADPCAVALAALRAAMGSADAMIITIGGPHPAVPELVERGGRIVDHDTFCATDPALLDPVRVLANPGLL